MGTVGESAALYHSIGMANGWAKLEFSRGGGSVAGRLAGGNLNSSDGGRVGLTPGREGAKRAQSSQLLREAAMSSCDLVL